MDMVYGLPTSNVCWSRKKKSKPEKEELLCTGAQETPALKSSVQKSGGDYLAPLDLDSWKCFFQIRTLCRALIQGTGICEDF